MRNADLSLNSIFGTVPLSLLCLLELEMFTISDNKVTFEGSWGRERLTYLSWVVF
jgi:hypothetical protein